MTVDRLKDIMDMARALEFQLVRFCDCDIDILAEGMVRLNVLTNAFVSMKSTIKCLEEGSVNESSSQSDSLPTDLCTLRQRVLDAEDRTSVRDDMIRAIKRLETIDPSVAYENVAAALKRDNQEKAAAGLLEARTALEDFDVEVRKKVARIVEEAGSPDVIVKSHAIHACATKASPVYIDLLMSFLPEEGNARLRAANGLDFDMETPLMRAARNVDIENLSTSTRTYECCERLLELGADKSLVNSILGRTAFGAFYTKFRSVENYELTFDKHLPVEKLQSRNEARLRFHRLLMPRDGPTEADRALLNHDADENDDDNDDVDADDDDDDDANDDYGEYDDDDAYYYDDYDYGSD
uniref:Ankyrin repeat protein n=1 Tax=Grammatophora oceanica TaxID=210454 RepID=A0A7S1V1A9_9STRA